MSTAVLVDTGPIVAILSENDEHHEACVEQLHRIRSLLLICWPVITEAAWLLRAYPLSIRRLLSSFHPGPFTFAPLDQTDLPGIAAILARYEDLGIQLADASLVHLANREGIEVMFTLDRVTSASSGSRAARSYACFPEASFRCFWSSSIQYSIQYPLSCV